MASDAEEQHVEDVFFTIEERGPITEEELRRIHPEPPIKECVGVLESMNKAKKIDAGWMIYNELYDYIGSWIEDNEPVSEETVKDKFDLDFREMKTVRRKIGVSNQFELYEHDDMFTSEKP
jgi:hypothetical protein